MKIITTSALAALTLLSVSPARAAARVAARAPDCQQITFELNRYIICTANLKTDRLELHLKDDKQQVLGSFSALQQHLTKRGRKLVFAFNAGMYHPARNPVGLFVSEGKQTASIKIGYGTGNFSLKPNGVFYIQNNKAAVEETGTFVSNNRKPNLATQSGPMLLINNNIHPKFQRDSSSRKIRNGVGVRQDGKTILFALALNPVNFHTFARLFRDQLKTPNALYLDGTISQIHSPHVGRSDTGTHMGPMIGVTAPLN